MKMRSLLFGLCSWLCLSAWAQDEVLLTIGNKPVYTSEFEYIYTKNNSSPGMVKQPLEDYLDLFVNFKL